ncbi:MAG: SGNH/GDSL hydrolase N-terminal domain-containing protein, partial [Armatimonadaceae bacterium]
MNLLQTGWVDAQTLTVEGRGWTQPGTPWIRLPERLRGQIRPELWEKATHSAGIALRFVCAGAQLDIRWELGSSRLSMPHLPSTAHSGVDLYVRTPDRGWRFVQNGRPSGPAN